MNNNQFNFGNRLLDLMENKGFSTPKALAVKFYDDKIVKVRSRKNTNQFDRRDNAISSIEKKIRIHTHADMPDKIQGEFVLAYCQFFECSADYLFGLSNVKIPSADVRAICDKTGLGEEAVRNLLIDAPEDIKEMRSGSWSRILASSIYDGLPRNWNDAGYQCLLVAQNEAALRATKWELQYASGQDCLALQEEIEGYKQRANSARAAYAGLLFNISRNIADFVESELLCSMKSAQDAFNESFMDKARKRHTKG